MALSISSSLFICCSLLLLLLQPSLAIYCDEDDCYDLLGVSQSANASEIKKAYYKLSLKHHPDKNPDPESKKLFVKIANAYEILKDEATREQYDYAIAHPEEVFYNTARYYHAYYGHKTDPRAVLVGLLLVVSALQYLNQWSRYTQAIDMVKKSPAFKNRLKALELERTGGVTNKKKGHKQMDKKVEEDLSNELELQIQGAEKPSMWSLFAVQFVLLPYTLGKLLFWRICWFWRYQIKKASYTWDDACYLTRSCLKVPLEAWENIGGGGDGERVAEGVGILEGDELPAGDGTPVINEAIVGGDAAEGLWVDEAGRAEKPAGEVNVPDVALASSANALVQDLGSVGGDAVGERRCRILDHHDVIRGAPAHPRSSVRCRCRYCSCDSTCMNAPSKLNP